MTNEMKLLRAFIEASGYEVEEFETRTEEEYQDYMTLHIESGVPTYGLTRQEWLSIDYKVTKKVVGKCDVNNYMKGKEIETIPLFNGRTSVSFTSIAKPVYITIKHELFDQGYIKLIEGDGGPYDYFKRDKSDYNKIELLRSYPEGALCIGSNYDEKI